MEKKAVLYRFNLFNSQNDHYNALHNRVQQILYYAESRFWSILTHLATADEIHVSWGQKLLHRELASFSRVNLIIHSGNLNNIQLFVLSYIGIGTSIGQPLKVPILLRSLAVGLASLDEKDLPVSFDIDFLMTLDTDPAEQNSICKLVQTYECAWWKARKPRDLDHAVILDKSTLNICLETHINQTPSPHSDNVQSQDGPGKSTTSHTPPERDQSTMKKPRAEDSCAKCLEYSQILANTLVEVVNIHTFANMMLSSSETQWHLDMHRASTFDSLHEAAVIKETSGASEDISSRIKRARMSSNIDSVRRTAEEELERLRNLPPMSHKWTWGESLTTPEVLALQRPGKKSKVHSGYGEALKDGKRVEDSADPSMPESWHGPDSAIADEKAPPDNNVSSLLNLEKLRSRVYDPLGKLRAPQIFPYDEAGTISRTPNLNVPRRIASLSEENLILLNAEEFTRDDTLEKGSNPPLGEKVADVMEGVYIPPDDDMPDTTIPVEIEDMWESASDSVEVGHHNSMVDNPTPTPIEDMWSSGSQVDEGTGIEDEWPTVGNKDDSPASPQIEDDWLPASDNDSAPANTSSAAPAPGRRFYTPADFAHLGEELFEEKKSDESSEYSE